MSENSSNYRAYKKVRKVWNINPVEQILPNKKKKKRLKIKQEMRKLIKEY